MRKPVNRDFRLSYQQIAAMELLFSSARRQLRIIQLTDGVGERLVSNVYSARMDSTIVIMSSPWGRRLAPPRRQDAPRDDRRQDIQREVRQHTNRREERRPHAETEQRRRAGRHDAHRQGSALENEATHKQKDYRPDA